MSTELTAEQIQRSISALGDSVKVVIDAIAVGAKDAESIDLITRNRDHLELMLTKDFILESGADLKPSQDAVKSATTFIAV